MRVVSTGEWLQLHLLVFSRTRPLRRWIRDQWCVLDVSDDCDRTEGLMDYRLLIFWARVDCGRTGKRHLQVSTSLKIYLLVIR